mmetsp:Transcript_10036/g.15474  ORF Transcript_10036/g.15474 Transcript_10036/m.15474 type:complete len:208 (+) Transcript_10036:131-754(+)
MMIRSLMLILSRRLWTNLPTRIVPAKRTMKIPNNPKIITSKTPIITRIMTIISIMININFVITKMHRNSKTFNKTKPSKIHTTIVNFITTIIIIFSNECGKMSLAVATTLIFTNKNNISNNNNSNSWKKKKCNFNNFSRNNCTKLDWNKKPSKLKWNATNNRTNSFVDFKSNVKISKPCITTTMILIIYFNNYIMKYVDIMNNPIFI